MSGSYNAVTWLLDRNIDEGRGANSPSPIPSPNSPMAICRSRAAALANMLRRLGVRREERVAMIMLDTRRIFRRCSSARSAPAWCRCRSTRSDLGSICLRAGGLPRARAVHLRGAAARGQGHGRADARPRACRRLRQRRARPQETLRRARARERFIYDRRDPCRRAGVLALFVGLDRHAQGRAAPAFQSRRDRRDLCQDRCSAFARTTSVSRRQSCSSPTALGNALTFPMSVGATTVLNSERPTPAAMFALMNKYNPTHLLRRADAVRGDAQRRGAEERARRQRACASAPPPARRCRNRSATPGRRASASTSSTASARPNCCTSSCRTRPAISNTAPPAVRCRATRCGWSTNPAPT